VTLGIITASVFAIVLAVCRPLLYRYFVQKAAREAQPKYAFFTELTLCLIAGVTLYTYNRITYGFPLYSIFPMMIGCIIAGFFIGLDSALNQERMIILQAMKQDYTAPLPKNLFSMTRKFTFITVSLTFFVAMLMALVFTRDIVWLTKVTQNATSIYSAQLSVTYEIFFIMAILMVLIINLIFAYSKNMQLLFKNETKVLEQVSDGNLSQKVPVATQDEFGVIAGHTNNMIDGLRHRFELLSAIKLAEEVQQNLLPRSSPYIKGLDISGTSLYCDETGGDYYDYFQVKDNRLGIAVADVCGHGVGAAILMTSVRAFLHMAAESYQSPAKLLNSINTYITRDCSISGRFTSMFFLELYPAEKSLRWVRAGHEPAHFFDSATQTFSLLDGPGLVLGVDQKHQYQDSSKTGLNKDDIILIGTDGIWESTNNSGEMFGQRRLQKIIRNNASESAQAIKEHIIKNVVSFRGELPQEDDITLVVIKIT
jgi:sigma-B regulation protein RsbU (phosphoserine phosphatase)